MTEYATLDLYTWIDYGGKIRGGIYAFEDMRRISAFDERVITPKEAELSVLLDALDDIERCYTVFYLSRIFLVINTNGNWLKGLLGSDWKTPTDTLIQMTKDKLRQFAGWEVKEISRRDIEIRIGAVR